MNRIMENGTRKNMNVDQTIDKTNITTTTTSTTKRESRLNNDLLFLFLFSLFLVHVLMNSSDGNEISLPWDEQRVNE